MSEHAHHGIHPDADLLAAFAENALPEHERVACLEHLAGCPECREIVFVAQGAAGEDAMPAEQPGIPAPRRRRWFVPVWVSAAAVVVIAVSVAVISRHKETPPPPPQLIASATAPGAETPVPAQPPPQEAPPGIPKKAVITRPLAQPKAPEPDAAAPPPPVEAMKSVAPAPVSPAAPPATAPLAFAPQAAPAPFASAAAAASPLANSAGVTGTVTDPAGAAIAKAQVSLTDPASNKTFASATDTRGAYTLTGIPPGHYQLSFVSPGFKKSSNTIDLQPLEIAKADSALQVGDVAESVSVTAEVATVNLSSAERTATAGGGGGGRGGGRGGRGGAEPPDLPLTQRASALQVASPNVTISMGDEKALILLPNKQPAVTTAVSGKITLAADSNGTLFLSSNSEKSWKEIKAKWKGKVVRVLAPPDAANAAGAVFQLNTDSGAIWLSKNGSSWNPAPPAR